MSKFAAVIPILILAIITTPSLATVYQVGDEAGWTSDPEPGTDYDPLKWTDYYSWATSKNFYVGDILVFNYDKFSDSVLRVTEGDIRMCFTTNPLAVYISGSDAVTLDTPGDNFFITDNEDHCWNNQRLRVFVNPLPPNPSVSVTPSPPSPRFVTPSPSQTPSPTYSVSASPVKNSISCVFLVFAAAVASFLVIV